MKHKAVLVMILAISSALKAQVSQDSPPHGVASILPVDGTLVANGCQSTEMMAPPSAVVALDGYSRLIPLAWKPVSSDTLLGYDVYRSTSSSGAYSRVAQSIKNCYYRDETASSRTTFYYKIQSVYAKSVSGFSATASAKALENGYIIQSTFTSTAPVVDGVIHAAEWSQARMVDVLYPGLTGVVRLYVQNDQNRLYLAVDDQKNPQLDSWDAVGIFFDRDMDREWSSDSKSEGLIQVYWDNGSSKNRFLPAHGKWPDKLSLEGAVVLSGITQGISASSGHVQTEIAIDLRTAPFNYLPFSEMGFLLYVYDGGNGQFSGTWPQETAAKLPSIIGGNNWAYGPFSYGDLILTFSPPSSFWADVDRDHDVDIIDIQLVASRWGSTRSSANFLAAYDVNSDGTIDIFDIQLVASWWNKPVPAAEKMKRAMAEAAPIKVKIIHAAPEIYEIWADGASEMAAFQMALQTDGTGLKEMALGDFLSSSGNTAVALPPSHDSVRNVVVAAFSYGDYAGASGSGKLAELCFEHKAHVVVTDFRCADKSGRELAVEWEEAEPVGMVSEFRVFPNHPNPFNGTTMLSYALPEAAEVTMSIYNTRGQLVVQRELGAQQAGLHTLVWDGSGQSSGLYFCRIATPVTGDVVKLMLLR